MKPTMRKSGKMMITFRATFHVDHEDAIYYLCCSDIETGSRVSKAQYEEVVRQGFCDVGYGQYYDWRSYTPADEAQGREQWATDVIDGLFPDYSDGDDND